jgi:hypothetical protein
MTQMEITDQQLGLDKCAVEHLVETVYERFIADETADVCSVQPPHQTLT